MELIKKINNNFAIAKDSSGKEIIVSGKGIGFIKMPSVLTDSSSVSRVYYGISPKYISFLSEIPEAIINVSEKIVEYAKSTISENLNPNLLFTIADHTDFCIKRIQQGMKIDFSMTLDFKLLYKKELEVGYYAIKLIKEDMGIDLPEKEAYGFAMNCINSKKEASKNTEQNEIEYLIDLTVETIEKQLNFKVIRNADNYERFELHLRYLFSKIQNEKIIVTSNDALFHQMCIEHPGLYECVDKIKSILYEKKGWQINNDELLYMMLHIHRIYFRQQHSNNI